jgi:subtilisin family serine protease
METVNINTATPQQLSILLGLSPDELRQFIAARPIRDIFSLRRALPYRVAREVRSFDIPKLDLNTLSQEDLTRRLAVAPDVAQAIAKARPFYSVDELRHVAGITADTLTQVISVASVPEFSYTDKTTGRTINLKPDLSKAVVLPQQSEGVTVQDDTWIGLGLSLRFPKAARGGAQVFIVEDDEAAAGNVLARLRQMPGVDKAVPGFKEGDIERYLDPELCVVQFLPETPRERQDEVIAQAGLEIAERHRGAGLVTLRVAAARHQPGATLAALQFLNQQSEVKLAEPNYLGFDDLEWPEHGTATDTATVLSWHLGLIRAPDAWAMGQGSPEVIIAVVDSGVDASHPALNHAVLSRGVSEDWDFASDSGDPLDEQGHGTFIAGLLVGNGSRSVQGICPRCRLLPLKIPLSGEPSSYARRADAILYALEYAGSRRLVINTSWKTTGDVAVVRSALETVLAHGAIVVASAGNDPDRPNQPHFPSDYPQVISVAAVRPDRTRASYSFYGDRINVAAPGGSGLGENDPTQNLLSSAPNGGVTVGFGTSYAAPLVAGVFALTLSQNSRLTPVEAKTIVQDTAVPLAEYGLGYGLINAEVAIRVARGSLSLAAQSEGLAAINRGDIDALLRQFELRPFTARLLIARRPIARIDSIRGTLGLRPEQYTKLSASE